MWLAFCDLWKSYSEPNMGHHPSLGASKKQPPSPGNAVVLCRRLFPGMMVLVCGLCLLCDGLISQFTDNSLVRSHSLFQNQHHVTV